MPNLITLDRICRCMPLLLSDRVSILIADGDGVWTLSLRVPIQPIPQLQNKIEQMRLNEKKKRKKA